MSLEKGRNEERGKKNQKEPVKKMNTTELE